MHQLSERLAKLGMKVNPLSEEDGVYTLRITSQTMIARFAT